MIARKLLKIGQWARPGCVQRFFSTKGGPEQRLNFKDTVVQSLLEETKRVGTPETSKDLGTYLDCVFRCFIRIKTNHNKVTRELKKEHEEFAPNQQYVTTDADANSNALTDKNLFRLSIEFTPAFRSLVESLRELVDKLESGNGGNFQHLRELMSLVSKLNRSLTRWPQFCLLANNTELFLEMNQQFLRLKNKSCGPGLRKALGNCVVSALSAQQCMVHMFYEHEAGSRIDRKLVAEIEQSHVQLLAMIADGRALHADIRGLIGVMYIADCLPGVEPIWQFRNKIEELVRARVVSDLANYGTPAFNLGDAAWSFNKMVAGYGTLFEKEIELYADFFFKQFTPDLASRQDRCKFRFEDLTKIAWGVGKLISTQKTIEAVEGFKKFSEAFVSRWSTMLVTTHDTVSLVLFIDSLRANRLMTNEVSEQLQTTILPKVMSGRLSSNYVTSYFMLFINIVTSGTQIFPETISQVQKVDKLRVRMGASMFYRLSRSMQVSHLSRKAQQAKEPLDHLELQVMGTLISFCMRAIRAGTINNTNSLSMLDLYKCHCDIFRKRDFKVESKIMELSKASSFNTIIQSIELDAILADINEEGISKPYIEQLFHDVDALVDELTRGMTIPMLLQKCNVIERTNKKLGHSKISVNAKMYPRLGQFIEIQRAITRKFVHILESRMETVEAYSIVKVADFLGSFLTLNRRMGIKPTVEDMEIYERLVSSEYCNVWATVSLVRQVYAAGEGDIALFERLEAKLCEKVRAAKLGSISITDIVELFETAFIQKFFSEEYKNVLEAHTLASLSQPGFSAKFESKNIVRLLTHAYSFKTNQELVVVVLDCLEEIMESLDDGTSGRFEARSMSSFFNAFDRAAINLDDVIEGDARARVGRLISIRDGVQERLEKELNISFSEGPKYFLRSNLQEKTKEALDALGLRYIEEEYVEGFLCDAVLPDLRKVVEVMGPMHYVGGTDEFDLRTKNRIFCLERLGWDVVTLKNTEINLSIVERTEIIRQKIEGDAPNF